MGRYNFPENLRKARKEHGLTQNELAEGIGVSRVTVTEWENNTRYPTIDRLYDIAKFLEIPVTALVDDFSELKCQAE